MVHQFYKWVVTKYKRFRKSGDLISGLDDGAITYKGSINPKEGHSYRDY